MASSSCCCAVFWGVPLVSWLMAFFSRSSCRGFVVSRISVSFVTSAIAFTASCICSRNRRISSAGSLGGFIASSSAFCRAFSKMASVVGAWAGVGRMTRLLL